MAGKRKIVSEAYERALRGGLPMDKAVRMRRASDQGFDTSKVWHHGTSSTKVPITLEDISIGGVPIYRRGQPVDYSPHQFTKNPTARDYARANLQETFLIEEGRLKDAAQLEGERGLLREAKKIIDEKIKAYSEDWPELVEPLKFIRRRVDEGANRMGFSGGPSSAGIEAFDPNAFQPGMHGRGVYMTDSPQIAGGPNNIAPQGYATDMKLNDLIKKERDIQDELAQVRKTLSEMAPDDPRRSTFEEWAKSNEADLKALGGEVTGHPTVYPITHNVQNPFNPFKDKVRRKDLPAETLSRLEDAAHSHGESLSGKWPMGWDRLSYYLGDDGANEVLQSIGYDGLRYPGGSVTGVDVKHEVVVAFDPAKVRSINAKFDPANIGKNDLLGNADPRLLAALGGGAGAAALLGSSDAEAAPFGSLAKQIGKKTRKAFHGSPHDFDKFSLSKIGTGEGAQAYGHGLYFSSKEDIAKFYRDKLSGLRDKYGQLDLSQRKTTIGGQDASELGQDVWEVADQLAARNIGIDDYLKELVAKRIATENPSRAEVFDDLIKQAEKAAPELRGKEVRFQDPGKLYTVEIPDESHMLDWDKPLSEQPDQIREIAKTLGIKESVSVDDLHKDLLARGWPDNQETRRYAESNAYEADGATLYRALIADAGFDNRSAAAQQAASAKLRELGIPGITYKGGTSGERNFVVFDDELTNILEKGFADPALMALAGGGAGLAGMMTGSGFADGFMPTDPTMDMGALERYAAQNPMPQQTPLSDYSAMDWLKGGADMVADVASAAIRPTLTGPATVMDYLMGVDAQEMERRRSGRDEYLDYQPRTELGNRLSGAGEQGMINLMAPVLAPMMPEPYTQRMLDAYMGRIGPREILALKGLIDTTDLVF